MMRELSVHPSEKTLPVKAALLSCLDSLIHGATAQQLLQAVAVL